MKPFTIFVALVALLSAGSCRTLRPSGVPMAPIQAANEDQARAQLEQRRAAFREARSLMRVRATLQGKTQSFRAQLSVGPADRMTLIAFTPVGTTALTLTAEGQDVRVQNHLEGEEWSGSAQEFGRSLGFLGGAIPPSEVALLILGFPAHGDVVHEYATTGLRSARAADLTVSFDPPSFPAKRVTVVRGDDRIEIEHLEIVE